jgi:hypothetical protein
MTARDWLQAIFEGSVLVFVVVAWMLFFWLASP